MSPKQWLALLCVYISYLFFGASIFYYIEHATELRKRAAQLEERISINELLVKYASPDDKQNQNKVLQTLSNYCDRPVTNYTLDEYPVDFEWTFFHSFWFSFIVCSTVGYGNSSPHDQPGQAFCILFAIIGLPLNGFVLAYLGQYFSKTVTRIYNWYKGHANSHNHQHDAIKKFGLIGTLAMYLVPGIAFFIFLPACLFTYFEDWPYVRSVYYSFVTLTTIGFGDFVPTFQDGQARKFGLSFVFYQIFIPIWNFIGVGYFIMIIGFIAKGMQSKRVAQLEHQLSMNIKGTQHRIWTEFTKDVNFLRRILNEAHLMKFRPMYTNPTERASLHSIPRSASCPEISIYRDEYARVSTSRKRAYSENCERFSNSSTLTLNRSQSDGELSRIDKEKTFRDSGSLFQTNDLISNVLNALGSIRPSVNEDVHSCLEMYSGEPVQTDGSYEWTWDGSNSIGSIFRNQSESEMHLDTQNRSFMNKFNPFKDRVLSQESRRCSVASQDSNPQKYLDNTSRGRESLVSMSQFTCENMELLQTTSIADLIRAVEGTQPKMNVSPETPLLAEYKEKSTLKTGTIGSTPGLRRGSLRPTHDYTTIFVSSQNMKPPNPSRGPNNSTSIITPKRTTRRIRSTSSSIPTVQEHYALNQSMSTLHRTMSLRPTALKQRNVGSIGAIQEMPMITLQPPNVSRRDLLWHPEYQDKVSLQNELRRKRADSK
ncbi:open rectifier potassium channel protein 1-like isoform X4 [Bradysia coprophila]|uniref:open rectifier potassium channel protein 1-like isoform X4 n=1 Tax=Bradysia coprophila TaxID=38358 RepID=UPI00187DD8E2|nr:open rectifier potassium channel protein 1-like isoform X4 [Bradysia coprophila]